MSASTSLSMKFLPILVAVGALALSGPPPARAQNVLNGDFEKAPHAPSSTITDWTVGGTGHIHSIEQGSTSPIYGAAFNVGQDSQGTTLSQSISTVAGQGYVVDFDAGIYGTPSGVLQLNLQVLGGATLVNQTVTPPLSNTFDPNLVVFQHYRSIFDADSATTTLRFSDIGLNNIVADTMLDSVVVRPNLVLNGSFEAPPHSVNTVTNWTISGNGKVESSPEGSTTPTHSGVLNAGSDSENNVLSQSFATVVGQLYTLEFDAGVYGQRTGNPLQIEVQLLGSGTLLNQTFTPPDAGTSDPSGVVFQHYQFTFKANSTTTTLQFTDKGLGNAVADTVVDSVVVTPILIVNGNFEIAPFNSNGNVPGWTVSGAGRIAQNATGATSPTHGAAFNHGGDFQGNILTQTFVTTPGRVYVLDFDAGIFGEKGAGALQLKVEVLGTGTLVDQTVTPAYANTFNPASVAFNHYHYAFTANSTVTTLRFTDIGLGNAIADTVLDTVSVLPEFQLTTAVSRKTHTGVGTFDVNLPLSGEPGIECRAPGAGDSHTLVFTFTNNVLSGSASVTSGTGGVSGTPVFAGKTMTVELTGVTDVQQISVTLSGVTDDLAQVLPGKVVNMNMLLGDTTADKFVNSADISQTKSQSGSAVTGTNFRQDVTTDGSINSADISQVKSRSGFGLPLSRSNIETRNTRRDRVK